MKTCADQSLFESYLAPVVKAAYGTVFYLTGSGKETENLVQEAALRAYGMFPTFRPGSNFKAWFLKVLTTDFRDQYHKRHGEPILWEATTEAYRPNLADDQNPHTTIGEPSLPYLLRLTQEQIAAAFAQLPQEYRLVCALYFMGELSYQEIADIMECPFGTVRSCIHRGRKALLSLLFSIGEERSYRPTPATV